MIIYIEVVIIVNLLIHLFSLFIIKELLYLKFSKLIYFSLILDVIYILMYIYGTNFLIIKYIFPFILVLFAYKLDIFSYLKSVILYYILNYFLGGISLTLNISGNFGYLIIFGIFIFLVLIIYIFFKKRIIKINYLVSYKFKSKNYNLKAFLDTGCDIYYNGYPVIIINQKYEFNIYTDEHITYFSGDIKTIKKVYLINEIKIEKQLKRCYCIFLDIPYEAIIGTNML